MIDKVNSIVYSADSKAAARGTLSTIFTTGFIDALDAGATSDANVGSFTFTSDDGHFTTTVTGDGTTRLANLVDAPMRAMRCIRSRRRWSSRSDA